MSGYVTKDQIQRARKADLYRFLLQHHQGEVFLEGHARSCLRLEGHHSIVVKPGYSGYVRYSDREEKGNPIDLLMRYLGYSFQSAVEALAAPAVDSGILVHQTVAPSRMRQEAAKGFPLPAKPPYTRVFAFLTQTRGLDPAVIRSLIGQGLIYQDAAYGNAVFMNHSHSYCEIRGTLSAVKFHRTCREVLGDHSFWSFKAGGGSPEVVYICEGAIDAISLYELRLADKDPKPPSLFCSIGGVGNQRAIDWIARGTGYKTVLAVDNDEAGSKGRESNNHLEAIIPTLKDWNDDLRCQEIHDFKCL